MCPGALALEVPDVVPATAANDGTRPVPTARVHDDRQRSGLGHLRAGLMTGKGKNRIQTPEEWYRCRQPEIIQMLQEYQCVVMLVS